MNWNRAERSPLLGQEGWLRIKRYREAPLKAQTGWSVQNDHPVRAFQRLPSAIFLDGTATPPVPGGDYAIPNFKLTHYQSARLLDRAFDAGV